MFIFISPRRGYDPPPASGANHRRTTSAADTLSCHQGPMRPLFISTARRRRTARPKRRLAVAGSMSRICAVSRFESS